MTISEISSNEEVSTLNESYPLEVNSRHPASRTHRIAPDIISRIDHPSNTERLDEARITSPSENDRNISLAAESAGLSQASSFPNFAWHAMEIALKREQYGSEKIRALSLNVKEHLAHIDALLDVSSELSALPSDKDSHEISNKMKDMFAKLEQAKIQIWKGGLKITKDQLGEMKAQLSSHIDKFRTKIQTIISTEIQPEANNLQAIMNILQQIIQSDARLKRKTAELPR